jgi:hypothetical protein
MSAIVSYAGPPREALPELMARQRASHRRFVTEARLLRKAGHRGKAAQRMSWARMARLEFGHLKRCEHALNTRWRERTWERQD